jgi:DNA-binding NtrC family response regulator
VRSILIYSADASLIESCSGPLQNLGFFIFSAHAEPQARKVLHDVRVDLMLFDVSARWENALGDLRRVHASHPATPVILIFDPGFFPVRECAALTQIVTGFYNRRTPANELLLEVNRVFPALRQRAPASEALPGR